MFNFLPLRSNSLIIGWSFLLVSISASISSNTINIFLFFFIWIVLFNVFKNISISFKYTTRSLQSSQYFKPKPSRLLINNWYFATLTTDLLRINKFLSISGLSNAFANSAPDTIIINIMYGWSGIFGQIGFYSYI